MSRPHVLSLAALALVAAHGAAGAAPTAADIVGAGLYVASCSAGSGTGNGVAVTGHVGDGFFNAACNGVATPGAGPLQAASTWASANVDTGSSVAVGPGWLAADSAISTPGDGSAPGTRAAGGFGDTLTVNGGGSPGTAAFLLIDLHVRGQLDATANAGSTSFSLVMNKDNQTFPKNAGFMPGTGTEAGSDTQVMVWAAASYPLFSGGDEHQSFDETVTFSVPVVLGTPFELVLAGMSSSGTRSATGASVSSSHATVEWLGVQGLLIGGNLVSSGFQVSGTTGVNWVSPVAMPVPEPSGGLMLAAGMGLLAWRRRAR